jgi:predicted nucleic acid-binding protein
VIVVDASILANAVGDDDHDGRTARQRLVGDSAIAAPDLADVETVAVLRRRWLTGALSDERFADAVTLLLALPIERLPAIALVGRAYELRANVTAYDAMYVALAERLQCALLTADAKLASASGIRCPIEVLSTR